VLEEAISAHAFPAASIAVTYQDRLVALKSVGNFTYERAHAHPDVRKSAPPFSRSLWEEPALSERSESEDGNFDSPVTTATIFDLASLTKAVATTTMAMILYQRGLLELEAPVIGVIPEFLSQATGNPDPRRCDVTLRMLLAHSSGLPAYEKLFLKAHSRDALLQAVFHVPLSTNPGTRAEYSDIGFILLGTAIERLAGEPLDVFCQREVFGPLAMSNTTFNPPEESRKAIPPTADERPGQNEKEIECSAGAPGREKHASPPLLGVSEAPRSTFRQKIIQGEVQDENAYVLGGVAGHAGLFSTAEDLARFAHALLHSGQPILRPETIALFTRRESSPPCTSRALGWDTPSAPSQSGEHFGPRSYGHLGYTGTSLWIDPDRRLSITLLTNRTWPDCTNQAIKQIRPRFHDAITEALSDSVE
jgi:CubicO group peptidase (beta-lactamase class C family)